jgi:hypothetical protein
MKTKTSIHRQHTTVLTAFNLFKTSCPLLLKNGLGLLLLFFSLSLNAQIAIEWQKCLGGTNWDYAYSIHQTTDGGYVVAGWTASNDGDVSGNHGGADYWLVKLDAAGNIQWQKCLGGTNWDYAYSIHQTTDGGYVVAGTTGSNDGDVSGNHGNYDYWVVKSDASGNIQWQKCLGGTGDDYAYSIQQTTDGGYVVAGWTASNDGDVSGYHGGWDYWVVKLDASGNIQWQKCLGGTSNDEANSIQQTTDGGYVVAGRTESNNGDVSGNHGGRDYWVVKLNASGNIQWQKCLGGTSGETAYSIQQTTDGGYVVAGQTLSNDGDVSGNHSFISDYWVVKLDASGNIQWQKCLGGTGGEQAYSIHQTTDGGYMVAGYSTSNDGDVSGNHGGRDYWVVKSDASGNIQWQKCLGGTGDDYAYSIQQTTDGGYVVAGFTDSYDGDVSGNHGNWNYWIVKFTDNYNLITGKLFIDANSNGVQDAGEPAVANRQITEINTGRYGFSGTNGVYYIAVMDTGNYTVMPQPINYHIASPVTYSASFSGIQQTDSLNDFAFQPAGVFNDLCIHITPTGPFRAGLFNAGYMINYSNAGTTTINNCSVIFLRDSNVTYVSSNTTPFSITPDSVVWNIGTLTPFQNGSIVVTVNVNVGVPIGTLIHSGVRIEPVAGDANPACNYSYWEVHTIASIDPNDIIVDKDTLLTTQFPNPPFLEYIIRFQNTGNDTAFTVRVLNNISQLLDVSSFEFVASSHPVNITYDAYARLMTFTFDNILLPDSNVNEPLSHGFIRYRIKPNSNLVLNDQIRNSAAIYFDFNAPVITNTAITTVVLPTAVAQITASNKTLGVYPNPAMDELTIRGATAEIIITDLYSRVIYRPETKSQKPVTKADISTLAKGVYIVTSGTERVKFVKQ